MRPSSSQGRETPLQRNVIKALRARGHYARKIHSGAYQGAGLPDVLAIVRGISVHLETKRLGEEPSKIQARELESLRAAGAVAGAICSVEQADKIARILETLELPISPLLRFCSCSRCRAAADELEATFGTTYRELAG